MVRKKDGHTIISAIWNLSEDGTTLTDAYSENQPNGSILSVNYVYSARRAAQVSQAPGRAPANR